MSDSPSPFEIHSRLRELFHALDDKGINWLLFRGEERLQRPTGDVDVLIASRDLELADDVLTTLGFSRQGSALLVTRRAYVAFIPEDDLWLRLDVVTGVAFGELLEFDTPVAAAFLTSKRREGSLFLPDRNDAFWHLLLHYMLDRGEIPLPWREIIQQRAKDAEPVGPLAQYVDSLVGAASSRQVLTVVQNAGLVNAKSDVRQYPHGVVELEKSLQPSAIRRAAFALARGSEPMDLVSARPLRRSPRSRRGRENHPGTGLGR